MECWDKDGEIHIGLGYKLRFIHLRLALSHHRTGAPDGVCLKALTHFQERFYRCPAHTISICPRIVDGRLLLQTQFCSRVDRNRAQQKMIPDELERWCLDYRRHNHTENPHEGCQIGHVEKWSEDICPHLSTRYSSIYENAFSRGLRCKLDHPEHEECSHCSGLKQCSSCATEYLIEANDFTRGCFTIQITAWKDLGQGKSPYDPKWRQHVGKSFDNKPQPISLGSIRSAFEDGHI